MKLDREVTAIGKLRRSEEKNFQSLQQLCLRKIIYNVPYLHATPCCEPLASIPVSLMSMILKALPKMFIEKDGDVKVESLISWNTTQLYLNMLNWSEKRTHQALSLVEHNCKDALLELQVTRFDPALDGPFYAMLQSCRNLQVLNLGSSIDNEDTLAVIGANLQQLRDLTVCTERVTDAGLRYICVDDGTHGKCKKLERLDVVFCDNVSANGILCALENLPDLKFVGDNDCLFSAVLLFAEKYPCQKLKLTDKVELPSRTYHSGENQLLRHFTQQNIETFINTVPNINSLLFLKEIIVDVSIITKATKVTSFDLTYILTNLPISYIDQLIIHFAHQITNLSLKTFETVVNVGLIAQYCPNLKNFNYNCITEININYSSFENKFTKIESVVIHDNYKIEQIFPAPALKAILLSKLLKSVVLHDPFHLTDKLLDDVFYECLQDKNIFSSLNSFTILEADTEADSEMDNEDDLDVNDGDEEDSDILTYQSMIKLVCFATRLSYIQVDMFQEQMGKCLMRFLDSLSPERNVDFVRQTVSLQCIPHYAGPKDVAPTKKPRLC